MLAISVLAALFRVVPGPVPVYADPVRLYVDGATGSDTICPGSNHSCL